MIDNDSCIQTAFKCYVSPVKYRKWNETLDTNLMHSFHSVAKHKSDIFNCIHSVLFVWCSFSLVNNYIHTNTLKKMGERVHMCLFGLIQQKRSCDAKQFELKCTKYNLAIKMTIQWLDR